MKSKKVCSFILMCAMVFGGIGFTQSQMNTAYAVSFQMSSNEFRVWGEDSLRHDLTLVDGRNCPQGKDYVKSLIIQCIRERRCLYIVKSKKYDNTFNYYLDNLITRWPF